MKLPYLYIVLLSAFISCSELEIPNKNQFVVEGFITADFAIDDIRIKNTVSINDSIQDIPITDATISITSLNSSVSLQYHPTTQKYYDPIGDFKIEVGQSYEIEAAVNGTVATASTVIPDKPIGLSLTKTEMQIPNLTLNFLLREQIEQLFQDEFSILTWTAQPGRSYFVVIETQEEVLDPILPEGIPEEAIEFISSFRFISEPSEETGFLIFGVALETYGKHVAKVYSVNKEYVDLFNSVAQDSRDLNEPPSNIINGLGIFTGFAVDSVEFMVVR